MRLKQVLFYGVMGFWVTFSIISLVQQPVALAAEKEPIKIGAVGGLTGVFYLTVKPFVEGVNLAVKEINASNGILGRELETVMRDDETKIDVSVRETKDLILRKKVDFLFSASTSGVTLAQSEVAKAYKVPLFACTGNTHRATEEKGHRYIFTLPPNTRMEGSAVAMFIAAQGWKSIWIIAPDYEWGHTFMGLSLGKLKQLVPDLKVIGESWPKLGETDFTPYISAILSAKPDFIFSILSGADVINFTKQAKGYALYQKMKASGNYEFNILRALGDEMVEGAVGFGRGEFYCIDTPEMKTFVEKYRKSFGGEYPTVYSTIGYEAVYCVKQAMEKAKSPNKEKVINALEGMEYTSPRGKLFFRAYDHQVNGTVHVGFTTKKPEYPFYVLKDILAVPGEQTWLSVEEIKKLRGQK